MSGSAHAVQLAVRNLSKSFAGQLALAGFDLDVKPGEIHALIGENGSGKSTFIKILSGYHDPDDGGEITVAGSRLPFGSPQTSYALGCRFVHQDLGLFDDLSIMDNLLLGTGFPTRIGSIRERPARQSAAEDLARVGLQLHPERLVRDLRPAEKTGVALARALRPDSSSSPHVLVLDEPTATLPGSEVQRLLTMVRGVAEHGLAVIYVTHRLAEIFAIAQNVTVLRNGRKVVTKSVASTTREALVNVMVAGEFQRVRRAADHLDQPRREAVALRVDNLQFEAIRDISFDVREGELLGVAGITGSGAEALLATVFGGAHEVTAGQRRGTVKIGDKVLPAGRPDLAVGSGMAYMPPDRKVAGGVMTHSARENLTLASLSGLASRLRIRSGGERRETDEWFTRLSVRPADGSERELGHFSGGNQQKVLFAKWLRLEPSIFLLDEPTQGVDVGAAALLHRQLLEAAERGMAVVVSSTDIDELAALCQRVLVLRDGVIGAELSGSEVTVTNISRAILGTTQQKAA